MDHSNLDRIHIQDLLLKCIIGISPDERVKKQDVVINITLYADLAKPCKSDSIDDTIDYKKIKDKVVKLVEESSFFLIERMADQIAGVCLSAEGVCAAQIKVEKPGALRFAKSAGVEIMRERQA